MKKISKEMRFEEMRFRRLFNRKHDKDVKILEKEKVVQNEYISDEACIIERSQISEEEIMRNIQNKTIANHYPLHSLYENDIKKHNNTIGFLIVATGKYDIFLKPLIESIEKFVLPNNEKKYYIFSDKNIELDYPNYEVFNIEHKPFPYPTLYRFHFFDRYFDKIKSDQIVYIDADTLITDNIGTEIINPITVTQHCGFVKRYGSFESRSNSKCYVPVTEAKNYFGGGFYSFERSEFYRMMHHCKNIIDSDVNMGITPVWHDESAINHYMIENIPSRVLSPSYHYPENNEKIYSTWNGNIFPCKILLLNKNHEEIRK